MFIRAGYKIINTDTITDIDEYPAVEERVLTDEEAADYDYPEGNILRARPLRLTIHTTAPEFGFFGYDAAYPGSDHRRIELVGDEAEEFLGSLTVVGLHGVEPVV